MSLMYVIMNVLVKHIFICMIFAREDSVSHRGSEKTHMIAYSFRLFSYKGQTVGRRVQEVISCKECIAPQIIGSTTWKRGNAASLPDSYKRCVTKDITISFDNKGLSSCDPGYYMTAFFKGTCNKLCCIEKVQCC